MHLERLTHILEIVSQRSPASVADICAYSGVPQASVYRIVNDLVAVGMLESTARGRFVIGARMKRIADQEHSDQALVAAIAPGLSRAACEGGAAFFLSRLRGRSVEIIHVEVPDTGVSYLHPGVGKRPLHACSCSKAIAAFSPDILLDGEMEGGLKAYTEHTLTRPEDLAVEFETIRARGYAECVEELERGICSVAAPLAVSGPGATLAIGATGSVRVFTQAKRAAIGHQLTQMSGKLAAALGWKQAA